MGGFNDRDNNSKTKYLNNATILSVIYTLNFPELCDLIHFLKLPFQVTLQLCFFFFAKHNDEPLCLGKNYVFFCYNSIPPLNLWYHKQRLTLSNDIEVNPGQKPDSSQNFTICRWNLSSIPAYLTIHKTDIVRLSETFLDSLFPVNDENLVTHGYILVRCDILPTLSPEETRYP